MPYPGGGQAVESAACDIRELQALLGEQLERVVELLAVARSKTEAILDQNAARIQEATAAESRLVQEIQALEERRAAWVSRWAEAEGHSPEGPGGVKLSEVLARYSSEQAEPVQRTADALADALEKLLRVNRQNADLLYYSLAHVQTLLDALAGESGSHGLYSPDRRRAEAQPRALVDWRV